MIAQNSTAVAAGFSLYLDMDFKSLREQIDNSSMMQPPEPGVVFTPDTLGGVEVLLAAPEKISGNNIIFYIHGGGFCFGHARSYQSYTSLLAIETGLRVYSISYRLAPEHPFPAGVDDCFAVYRTLLDKYPGSSISLVGDSAGGSMALITTLRAMEAKIQLPSSVIVHSPGTNFEGTFPSHEKNRATEIVIGWLTHQALQAVYCPGQDLKTPYISPLYGNYAGFPPLFIDADSGEMLADDAKFLAEKARAAGVEVEFQLFDETFHAFPVTGNITPEGRQVLKDTIAFITKHFQEESKI
jgi:acetyl esterase/lipase